jgi:hypothetical protein
MDLSRLEFVGGERENKTREIRSIGNFALFLTLFPRVYPQLSA